MIIREITEPEWVEFFPTFTEVVEAGETYAFPAGLSIDEARGWWVESPPGVTVVALDEESGLWTGVFTVPAGTYEWKVAYEGTWDESYGTPEGDNLKYTTDGTPVRFFHDPTTKLSWAVNVSGVVTLPGSWQAALGCSEDWKPACLATAMRPLLGSDHRGQRAVVQLQQGL